MFRIILKLIMTLSLVIVSMNANAEKYWGLGAGSSSFDLNVLGVVPLKDATAIQIFMGGRNGNVGYEFDFSTADYDWEGFDNIASHSVTNLVMSGIGYLPVSNGFDVYGKVGINFWSTDVEIESVTLEGDDGIDLTYGAGLNFAATDSLKLRLEYQVLTGLSDGIDSGDISQLMLNFAYVYQK